MAFPTNPNVGDTFLFEDTVYTYNGRSWDRTTIGPNNNTRYANAFVTTALLTRITHLEALLNNVLLLE